MVAYFEQALHAQDTLFRDRVKVALVIAARDIAGEAQGQLSNTVYGKRQFLAQQVANSPDGYVDRFAWLVAVNSGLTFPAPVAISSSTQATPIVVTTAANHGLSTGDTVVIAGHLTNTAANGTWNATSLTSTTFSIPTTGNGVGGATGTSTQQVSDSDVQFTVNSVFNDVAGVTGLD